MSLKSFIDMADVKTKVKPLRPKLPRRISAPLKVEPRSNRYMLVGTAFDYLLRFELLRRASHAISEPLVAESASDRMWQPGFFRYLSMDASQIPPEEAEEVAEKEAKRARNVAEKAKSAIAAYMKMKATDHPAQADLAAHAIRWPS